MLKNVGHESQRRKTQNAPRVKEARETYHLNAMPDPCLGLELNKQKKLYKLFRQLGKFEYNITI